MPAEFSIEQIVDATGGKQISSVTKKFIGVGSDTRKSLNQKIFVALKGESFDAHKFLNDALEKGAACLLIHELPNDLEKLKKQVSIVKVDDTLVALQQLATYWRKQLKAKVFAITGSNGKTSTKEFLATILAECFKVHYSKGSFNNHWGVPFSILAASKSDEVLILEMGMNHAGEISKLVEIAIPDVVLCTMVGRAHIGNFGGKQEEIAKAKEEIYLSSPNAISVFNLDDKYTRKMFVHFKKRNMGSTKKILTFSKSKSQKISDVQLHVTSASFKGLIIEGQIAKTKKKVLVPVIGEHNVVNLMAASAMALAAKMPVSKIWKGLSHCHSEWGRNQLVQLDDGTQILFDAYNANPDSMSAMIQNIKKIQKAPKKMGRVFLVLGEMLELGDQTKKSHQELGEQVGALNCSAVWFMGESQKEFEKGFYAAKKPSGKKSARQLWAKSGINKINNNLIISSGYEESLAIRMRSMLNPQDVVVMKGSRGMKLEKVLLCWHPNFKTKNN